MKACGMRHPDGGPFVCELENPLHDGNHVAKDAHGDSVVWPDEVRPVRLRGYRGGPILVTNADENDPGNSAVKSGAKTTELWLSLIVTILGAIMASGLLDPADPTQATIVKVIGLVLSVAAALGYTQGRSMVKAAAIRGAADVAVARAKGVPGLDRDAA